MAYDDKPHRAEFGVRYGDDSGWERLVCVDYANDRVHIEIEGGEMSFRIEFLEWLENAIRTVRYATAPLKQQSNQKCSEE